jgi:hypothetical protein
MGVCIFVLFIRHAKRMYRIILSIVACPDLPYFSHYTTNGTMHGNNLLNIKYTFRFSLQLLSEKFLILRRNGREIIINVHISSCKVLVILCKF